MNCRRCQRLLFEYVDATLAPRRRAAVDEHLRVCANCQRALAEEQQLAAGLRSLFAQHAEGLTLRPEVRRKVLTSLESPVRANHLWIRPAWWLAATACVAVAIGVSLRWYTQPPAAPLESSVYIKCVKTECADATCQQWVSRTLTVLKKNGGESYAKITVTRTDTRKGPKT